VHSSGAGARTGTAPEPITVAAGPVRLGARWWPGDGGRPVLLVHGLSSNARLWDELGAQLAAAGHPVVAVDLRGHGSSADVPDPAPDHRARTTGATATAAGDLAAVCESLGATASAATRPVVAGQSWGGNVVLQLAADRPDLVHAVALVDGGWLHLGDRWPTLDAAWAVLAPPDLDGLRAATVRDRLRADHPDWSDTAVEATLGNLQVRADGTVTPWLSRQRHRAIVGSMLSHRPRELYRRVRCRTLLLAATGDGSDPGTPAPVAEALRLLPGAELVGFPGGDHDLHAQHPDTLAELIGGLA
jgi:pimeloyl-ACP methyl ester carboxylesterase